jgi:hypothetical protein
MHRPVCRGGLARELITHGVLSSDLDRMRKHGAGRMEKVTFAGIRKPRQSNTAWTYSSPSFVHLQMDRGGGRSRFLARASQPTLEERKVKCLIKNI